MKSKNFASIIATLIVLAIAVCISGCNGGGSQLISVTFPASTATVEVGATAQFTATVTNDSANRGVNWSLTCSVTSCGTVSPISTASGAPTTYTPPASQAGNLTVNLIATSATDATKSGSVTITIPGVTLNLSATTATVQPGATASFSVTLANDGANKGVTWSVSCSQSACGSVSPTTTASGSATTYTAPTTLPAGNLTVMLTATSATDSAVTASVKITVSGITVSVSPATATVQLNATAQFSAAVSGDPSKGGVTWSVSCSVAPCGSVSPTMTASGASTTYTPPSTPPTGNLTVTLTAASVTNSAATGTAAITVPGISIAISPSPSSVPSGGTQQFTATVSNDSSNGGVTWTLIYGYHGCNPFNHRCGPIQYQSCTVCGMLAPASTASGAPTSYTAPAHFVPPRPPFGFFVGVYLQATSVTNTTALSRASITILPISVSVSPTPVSVALNATLPLTATVANDGTNSGVTWSLTQNSVSCSPGCGTIAPASTASGSAATYTAPSAVPPLAALTVTATSVEDPTKSAAATVTITTSTGAACGVGSGSESLLKGQYAFLLRGSDKNGPVFVVGSFTADGTGKITAGEEDSNSSSVLLSDFLMDPAGSFYSVGSDHRGCLTLSLSGGPTTYFRFALGSINSSSIATAGHILEFDDTSGTGQRLAGTIRMQDATSFAASHLKGNYIIGLHGSDLHNSRLAIAGTFASDGVSALSSGTFDINDGGTISSNLVESSPGSFTCCSANGRGTLALQISTATLPAPNFALYMIGANDAFLANSGGGQFGGELIAIPSGAAFTQASLSGASILRETAQSSSGPVVDIATANADGKGALTVNDNENNAGTFKTSSTALNFIVASNSRVAFTGGSTPPVMHLYGPNQGFLVGTDPDVTFGILEPQAAGPFSNASFSGSYLFGTENPSVGTVTLESGVVTANGGGNATGTADQSGSTGLAQNQSLNFTYSFPANGAGNVGSGTTAILISGNKLVFISNTSANPTITVVEK
jgi:hypothetical protein